MSRSSAAATSGYPSQLPSKSAWARGPPQQNSSTTIPRAQSPVPPTPVSSPTYPLWFGRSPPSTFGTFGQEVPTKDGVSIPRNPAKKVITHFGSVSILNEKPDSAESVSPPTSTPPPAPKNDKPDFAESVSPPTSTPPPAPKFDKKALEKLFQGPSTHRGQPYQPSLTSGALRQGQNGNPLAPWPPVYPYLRLMANGQNNNVGVSGLPQADSGDGFAPPAALSSPRLTPHPPPPMWFDFVGLPQDQPGLPQNQIYQPRQPGFLKPQDQPPQPPQPPYLLMSSRNPSLPLQHPVDGDLQELSDQVFSAFAEESSPSSFFPDIRTSQSPIFRPAHPPPPLVTSPTPAPSTSNRSTPLSANADAFVSGQNVSIKTPPGQEINILDALGFSHPPTVPPTPSSVKKGIKRQPVRLESEEQKGKRLAEERAKEGEVEEKSNLSEALVRVNEGATRREIGEQEPHRIQEQRKMKEEAERAEKELKEAEERKAREEEDRYKELVEEEERAQREAQEKAEKERVEQQRLRQLREGEEASVKEAESQRGAEGDAAEVPPGAHAFVDEEPTFLPEGGEFKDKVSQPTTDNSEKLLSDKTTDPSSPSLSSINSNTASPLPSALATARHIEDINRITYPQGIKGPEVELNVNTQKGKFRYDRDFLLQFMNICKEEPDNLPPLDVIGLEPSDTSHTVIPTQPLVGSSKGASTPLVHPVPEPALPAEVAPDPRSDIVPASIHSTALEIHPESIQVYPASYVSTPPDSPSRAETEHAANGALPIQQSDSIEQHGRDEPQLSTKMSSQPDEAFLAPMIFPPLKYCTNLTKKPKSACPNPVLNDHAISSQTAVKASPVLVLVDNASSADTRIPQNNTTEPRQEAVVTLPSSSGAMRDQSANPSESEQSALTAYAGDRTIPDFSNSCDASPIDDPIPPTSEVGSAMPVRKSPSGDCAAGDSNKYLSGEFFGYDTGTDEWPPVSQQPIVYLEGTPDHGQTRPTESGTILASQYDDHVGLVSVDRFAIIGWQEYLILDGTRYFSNATLHVVTDVDLRKSEELDAVTRFLDGPDTEILPPPQWELWLRDGNESTQGFIPVKVWIHHGARMVVSKHPGSDLVKHLNEGIDRMESEYHYWQYVMSHPVHALLPPEITAEAVDVLTCIYSSWLAPSPPHSRPPFSQEECQELLTQLRSFSHTSAQTRSLARTSVVSTVLVRVVAWRQGRHWDCGTFQDSRQSKNDPSDGASLTRTGGGFSISSFGSGLHVSWNDHIINVSAREVMYVVLLVFGFSLGRLLA